MTFSRPATRQVNALFRPARPNRVEVDRVVVRPGAVGPLRDYTNPEQVGRNAGQGLAELSNFLKNVVADNGPLDFAMGQQLNRDVDRFAELSQDPTFMDAYRAGDEQVRAQVNALRPEVRDIAALANMRAARLEYQEILATNVAKSPELTERPAQLTDEQWDELRAKRFAEIKQQAATESKLDRVQPQYLAAEIAEVERVNSAAKAMAYNAIAKNDKKAQDSQLATGFGAALRELGYTIQQTYTDSSLTAEQRNKKITSEAGFALGNQLMQLSRFRVSSEIVEDIIWPALNGELSQALADGSAAGLRAAMGILASFDLMARREDIKLPGGAALGAYRFEDGSTVRSRLSGLQLELDGKLEQAQQKEAWRQPELLQLMVAAAKGELPSEQVPQAIAALGQWAMQADGGAPMFNQVLQMLEGNRQFGEQLKAEKELPAVLEIEADLTRETRTKEDVEAARSRILSSNLSIPMKIKLLGRNQSTPDQRTEGIARARAYLNDEVEQSGEMIATAIARRSAELARTGNQQAASAVQADPKLEARNVNVTATRMAEKRVAEIIEGGGSVSEEEYINIYRNELQAATRSRIKAIGAKPEPQQRSYAQQVTEEVGYVQERLMQNGGRRTVDIFPPSVVRFAQQNGYPTNTYESLQRAMIRRMQAAREPVPGNTGQMRPVFPDPAKDWRQLFDRVRSGGRGDRGGERGSGSSPTAPRPVQDQRQSMIINGLVQTLGIGGPDLPESMVASARRPLPTPAPPRPGGAGQAAQPAQAVTPQRSVPEQLVGGALNLLMGVQPAAAAQQGRPQSQQSTDVVAMSLPALKVLADLFKGVQPMTIKTPVLPQAAATQPAARVPLAINNDKHPMFLAIGINEGTRTADGGYTKAYFGHTDPGNGARNVGTVSGQQGGSPQQSDRRWAGILTQTAAATAPILQRLGLPPGSVGFNRIMFNVLDLKVQAPAAVPDFIKKLAKVAQQGVTIEAIAKARADSFINPATGRLEAGGFGNSYDRLLRDQRSRAGTFDYKRRL